MSTGCIVCGGPIAAKDRCRACYRHWRRRGQDRSTDHVYRARRRAMDRELERAWQRELLTG